MLLYLLTQPDKTEILCQSVVRVAEKNGGHLVEEATQVAELFKETFGLFSLCHNTYNAKYTTGKDIVHLGEVILYRSGIESIVG